MSSLPFAAVDSRIHSQVYQREVERLGPVTEVKTTSRNSGQSARDRLQARLQARRSQLVVQSVVWNQHLSGLLAPVITDERLNRSPRTNLSWRHQIVAHISRDSSRQQQVVMDNMRGNDHVSFNNRTGERAVRIITVPMQSSDVLLRPYDDISDRILPAAESGTCSLCISDYSAGTSVYKLACGHEFHAVAADCCDGRTVLEWYQVKHTCPLCRMEFAPPQQK